MEKLSLSRRQTMQRVIFLAAALAALLWVIAGTGSRVRIKNLPHGPGVAYSAYLAQPLRSYAIYEDVYWDDALYSSLPRIADGALSNGSGTASRSFSNALHYWFDGSGFVGLNCALTGAHWSVELPEAQYTGCGSVVGADGTPQTLPLSAGSDQVLFSIMLSTQANGGINVTDPLENNTVVQFRLVPSTDAQAHAQ